MFEAFPKIPRLRRTVVVTEKIDGTNAQVLIVPESEVLDGTPPVATGDGMLIYAGSRNRLIRPGKATDNHGFAAWVANHSEELLALGPGRHFGEWFGAGIQRGYGLTEKRFALFNTSRWNADNPAPACCDVVPVIAQGDWSVVDLAMLLLRDRGSCAVPGFNKPEGIVVYHPASRMMFKQTLFDDDEPKSKVAHSPQSVEENRNVQAA